MDNASLNVMYAETEMAATTVIKQRFVIFDLDGCVSDDEWRLNLIKSSGQGKWDSYHDALGSDEVIKFSAYLIQLYRDHGVGIVFCTARPEKTRATTEVWLATRLGMATCDYGLIMRQEGDKRTSPEYKAEALTKLLALGEVLAAFDDRYDVVSVYKKDGVHAAMLTKESPLLGEVYWPMPGANGEPYKHGNLSVGKPVQTVSHETAADFLAQGAATFRERNAVYQDNWIIYGAVMAALFPDGIELRTPEENAKFSIMSQMVSKITRFSSSGMTHRDSVHDLSVYCAIMESIIAKEEKK